MHHLSFSEALSNYSILTVGDGLVSQIPAVIVSVAAALLLSKGREDGAIDLALVAQLGGNAAALFIVSGILGVFALFPGLPFIPFMLAAIGFATAGWFIHQQHQKAEAAKDLVSDEAVPEPVKFGDSIHADEIHLEVAPDLVNLVLLGDNGFESRIQKIRRYIAEEYGFVLPPIRMTDNPTLKKNEYRIRIQGVRIDSGFLRPGQCLRCSRMSSCRIWMGRK